MKPTYLRIPFLITYRESFASYTVQVEYTGGVITMVNCESLCHQLPETVETMIQDLAFSTDIANSLEGYTATKL
jgi:hypothetical protein